MMRDQTGGRWASREVMRGYVGITPTRQGAGALLAQIRLATG